MLKEFLSHIKNSTGKRWRGFVLSVFCLFFSFHLQAQDTTSLFNQQYTFNLANTSIYQALFKISNKVGYNFSYNSTILDGDKNLNLKFRDKPLKAILDSILQDTTLQYELLNEHIIIYKKNAKPVTSDILNYKKSYKSELINLRGKVVDEKRKDPIAYCNIGLKDNPVGTISNINGEFLLKVPKISLEKDTVVISYLGYNNVSIPARELVNRNNPIVMEKKSYSIQEVIVRWADPYDVVYKAIAKTRENYFNQPVMLTSFYRESIKKEDEFTSISEAVMNIYKAYSKMFQGDQIKILKSRKSVNYNNKDEVFLKLKSGLEAILLLDIIDEGINFLNLMHLDNYNYEYNGINYYNNHDTYEIKFYPDKTADIPLFSGSLYIDVETHAIVAAEFHLDNENLSKIENSLVIRKKWDLNVKPKQAKYTVNYRELNNKFFLNHIRGELIFKVRKKNEFIGEDYTVSFEMLTSEIDTVNVAQFDSKETVKPHQIFLEEIRGYDPLFWGKYNYILPEEPIRETLDKMNTQIKMLQQQLRE